MISVDQALEKITSGVSPLSAVQVNLTDALGRILIEDVAARVTQPPADVSSMDG